MDIIAGEEECIVICTIIAMVQILVERQWIFYVNSTYNFHFETGAGCLEQRSDNVGEICG